MTTLLRNNLLRPLLGPLFSKPAAPVIFPSVDDITPEQTVTLIGPPGVDIFYTLDDTVPITGGGETFLYTAPFTLPEGQETQVRARSAFNGGYSETTSHTFNVVLNIVRAIAASEIGSYTRPDDKNASDPSGVLTTYGANVWPEEFDPATAQSRGWSVWGGANESLFVCS